MNLIDMKQIEWKPDSVASVNAEVKAVSIKEAPETTVEPVAPQTTFGKLKSFVRKAVDCCIE